MPYIAINTMQELSATQKERIKAELGRLMTIIPTKTEAGLLIDFSGGHVFYKGGIKIDGAFVDLRLFHESEFEPKKKYTEEVLDLLSRELSIKKEHMYLTISEYENWGSNGELH
jgi:phenylpyruvate tautomerase PptA (4-oxalocrotonate tautomerase family)